MPRILKPLLLVLTTCVINLAVMAIFFNDRDAFGTGTPLGNGDVNGDRSINITDAVYLLDYLFNSGTAPVAIASSGLSAEEQEILSHMSIEMLPDGQGGFNRRSGLPGSTCK